MLDSGCQWLFSVAGRLQRRLMIVQFHRVLSRPDSLLLSEPDVDRFAEQIGWLKRNFDLLPVHAALELLFAGRLPPRTLCITFDDGYRDNAVNALPVLQRFGARATFFVTTRYLDRGMMWNDRIIEALRRWSHPTIDLRPHGLGEVELPPDRTRVLEPLLEQIKYLPFAQREALADELLAACGASDVRMMMNEDEIRALQRAGMEIGGHTESHPILRDLSDEAAMAEIAGNKARLEAITGTTLTTFAYPNGRPQQDYELRHVALIQRAGYQYALTTAAGTATANSDPYQIPRFTPADRTRPRYLARLALNYFRDPEILTEEAARIATA